MLKTDCLGALLILLGWVKVHIEYAMHKSESLRWQVLYSQSQLNSHRHLFKITRNKNTQASLTCQYTSCSNTESGDDTKHRTWRIDFVLAMNRILLIHLNLIDETLQNQDGHSCFQRQLNVLVSCRVTRRCSTANLMKPSSLASDALIQTSTIHVWLSMQDVASAHHICSCNGSSHKCPRYVCMYVCVFDFLAVQCSAQEVCQSGLCLMPSFMPAV